MFTSKKNIIMAVSLDYDGCLGQGLESHEDMERDVLSKNRPLIDHIKIQLEQAMEGRFFIGSNRQSLFLEYWNWSNNNNGCCFINTPKVADYFSGEGKKCNFDGLLLADIFHQLEPGTSWQQGKKWLQDHVNCRVPTLMQEASIPWINNKKYVLIYAQIHYLAFLHPEAEINFHFYDDTMPILKEALNYFKKNENLIPRNVNLNLWNYWGESVKCAGILHGKGEIDINYNQTVRNAVYNNIILSNPDNAEDIERTLDQKIFDFSKCNISDETSVRLRPITKKLSSTEISNGQEFCKNELEALARKIENYKKKLTSKKESYTFYTPNELSKLRLTAKESTIYAISDLVSKLDKFINIPEEKQEYKRSFHQSLKHLNTLTAPNSLALKGIFSHNTKDLYKEFFSLLDYIEIYFTDLNSIKTVEPTCKIIPSNLQAKRESSGQEASCTIS